MGREEGGGFRMGNTCFKIIKLKIKKKSENNGCYFSGITKINRKIIKKKKKKIRSVYS